MTPDLMIRYSRSDHSLSIYDADGPRAPTGDETAELRDALDSPRLSWRWDYGVATVLILAACVILPNIASHPERPRTELHAVGNGGER